MIIIELIYHENKTINNIDKQLSIVLHISQCVMLNGIEVRCNILD